MQLLVFTSTPPPKAYAYVRNAEDYGRRLRHTIPAS